MRLLAAFLALFVFTRPLAAQPGAPFPEDQAFREATNFMASYAEDLRHGNRTRIAARYSRNGAHFLGNGRSSFEPYAAIVAQYAGADWQSPWRFEWRNLSYLFPACPRHCDEAVVVAGQFLWTPREGAQPLVYSYTVLLSREDGVLRIALEDESTAPGASPEGASHR